MSDYNPEEKVLGIEKGWWKDSILPLSGFMAVAFAAVATPLAYMAQETAPQEDILKQCDLPDGSHIEEIDSINKKYRNAQPTHELHIVVTSPDGEKHDYKVAYNRLSMRQEMSVDEAFDRLCAGEAVDLMVRPSVPR